MASAAVNVSSVLQARSIIEQTINDLDRAVFEDNSEGLVMRLDYLCRSLVNNCDSVSQTDSIFASILTGIVGVMEEIRSNSQCSSGYLEGMTTKEYTGNRGRPTFNIEEPQLSYMIENGFKVPVIAKLFGVSTSTIERRMAKYGLSISGKYLGAVDMERIRLGLTFQAKQFSQVKGGSRGESWGQHPPVFLFLLIKTFLISFLSKNFFEIYTL